jgi:hypothetical protein
MLVNEVWKLRDHLQGRQLAWLLRNRHLRAEVDRTLHCITTT